MDAITKKIKENPGCIVITSLSIKQKLVERMSQNLVNVSYKLFDEFKEDLFGKVDDKMVLDNFNNKQNLEVLKIKLDNALKIFEDSDNHLIHELYELHQKMNCNKPFINEYFLKYYNGHQVYLIGYDKSDDLINLALKKINNVETLELSHDIYTHQINHFNDFQDEIIYIVNTINQLFVKGIKPEKIIINKVNDDYSIKFKEIFSLYHIAEEMGENISLYDIDDVKQFINDFLNNASGNFSDAIGSYLETTKHYSDITNQVVNALNVLSYYNFDVSDPSLKEIIIYLLKHHFVRKNPQEQVIRFENVFDNLYDECTYLFIPNFNQGVIPKTIKDNTYLSDNLKKKYGFLSSNELNKNKIEQVISFIKRNKNIILTSSSKSTSQSYVRNVLLDDQRLQDIIIETNKVININEIKSYQVARLKYIKACDLYNSYHIVSPDFELGYNTFNRMEESDKYDNNFTKISPHLLEKFVNPLILSYSTIDDYARCPFYYYTKNILKIVSKTEKTTDNTSILIGIIFHYVLEKLVKEELNNDQVVASIQEKIEKYVSDYVLKNQIEVNPKLDFYLHKLITPLTEIYDRISNHLKNSQFTILDVEKRFEIKLDETTFIKGFVDKILAYDNYYIVVDYKTKNVSVNWMNLDKALELQLPFYLLFIKELDKNGKIAGAYLQSILSNSLFKYQDDKSYSRQFDEATAYVGYTNSSHDVIRHIDNNCETESRILSHVPFKKNGDLTSYFLKYALNDDEFEKIIKYTKCQILEISKKIKQGDFPISPKHIDKSYDSCSYCPSFSLCYKTVKNIELCKENSDLSYIMEGTKNEME